MVSDSKLTELIVHLASHPRVRNLGPTKLWKLLYFIDARALRDLGTPITGAEFIKYQHGPVSSRGDRILTKLVRGGCVRSAQRDIKGRTLNEITAVRAADLSLFSAEERGVIDVICEELGSATAAKLSQLSHQEPSWHYAEPLGKLSPELIAYGRSEDPEGL